MKGTPSFEEPPWYRGPGGDLQVSVRASKVTRAALAVPETASEWRALGERQAAAKDCMAAARVALYDLLAEGKLVAVGQRCRWRDPVEGDARRKARDREYGVRYRQEHPESVRAYAAQRAELEVARRAQKRREDPAYAEKRRQLAREQKARARLRAKGLPVPPHMYRSKCAPGQLLQAVWR